MNACHIHGAFSTAKVYCGSTPFPSRSVTTWDRALRCLQHRTEPSYVWVDFVCINQDDKDERKKQVQLMYSIYGGATAVIAYLGKEVDGSQSIPDLLRKIRHAHFSDDAPESDVWSEEEYVTMGLPSRKDEAWTILRNFVSRPWFTRAWIIQEALAARKLYLICGLWICEAMPIIQGTLLAGIYGLPHLGTVAQQQEVIVRTAARSSRQLSFMVTLGVGSAVSGGAGLRDRRWTLLELLEGTRYVSASDPRDRVFALLNLCQDSPKLKLEPDYNLDTQCILKQVAQEVVKAG